MSNKSDKSTSTIARNIASALSHISCTKGNVEALYRTYGFKNGAYNLVADCIEELGCAIEDLKACFGDESEASDE